MSYTKYSDPAALISEMCFPFTYEEKMLIADLGVDLRDEEFAKAYFIETKKHYLKYMRGKETNNLQLWAFRDLDSTIRQNINITSSEKKKEVPLLPEYANFEQKASDNQSQNIMTRIAQLRVNKPK